MEATHRSVRSTAGRHAGRAVAPRDRPAPAAATVAPAATEAPAASEAASELPALPGVLGAVSREPSDSSEEETVASVVLEASPPDARCIGSRRRRRPALQLLQPPSWYSLQSSRLPALPPFPASRKRELDEFEGTEERDSVVRALRARTGELESIWCSQLLLGAAEDDAATALRRSMAAAEDCLDYHTQREFRVRLLRGSATPDELVVFDVLQRPSSPITIGEVKVALCEGFSDDARIRIVYDQREPGDEESLESVGVGAHRPMFCVVGKRKNGD